MLVRHLIKFIALVLLLSFGSAATYGFETVVIPEDIDALDLKAAFEVRQGADGRLQLSTAPDGEGIIRRIEVTAVSDESNPKWAIFALRNESDVQLDRLLVAPHFRLAGSGVITPNLGAPRIGTITPSQGFRPDRRADAENDVFAVTLDPGATVTFMAELTGDGLPELYLWEPEAFKDYINSFTLFRGTVLGIAGLLTVFLSIMFVVKGMGIFPTTAALAWAVLVYLGVDFGIFSSVFNISGASVQPMRAASEVFLAITFFGFLFVYLNLHRWHLRFVHLAIAWLVAFAVLLVLAMYQPSMAAGIARITLAVVGILGFVLIVLLAIRRYDRALMVVPTWIVFLAWIYFSYMVVSGKLNNDIAEPAVAGGLVLIVMLLGFTVIQHAFADGQVSLGALSEVERKALALTGSGDFIWDWNVDRDHVNVSDELHTRLGLKKDALKGPIKGWMDQIHPDERDRFRTALETIVELGRGKIEQDFRVVAQDGTFRTLKFRVRPVQGADGATNRCVGTIMDVTEERATRLRLLNDAVHDNMTGLPNKELFIDRLDRALTRSRDRGESKPSVFLIDIDNFFEVNETIGHSGADTLLLGISRRLSRVLRPLDTLARINGDQFAVILLSEQSAKEIADIAEQLRKAMRVPFTFEEREISLSSSIGITIYDNKPMTAEEVLKDAELAMYHAKRHGGDRIEAFRASARSIATLQSELESDLSDALERGELKMLFQPIVDVNTNRIIAAESLMRWDHPVRGSISPSEFIPLAERSGLISKLGRMAIEQAARHLHDWRTKDAVPEGFFVSVNLSTRQLMNSELLSDIASVLKTYDIPDGCLKLEVTESQIMANPENCSHILSEIRALGVGLAIDDFGTGHSSFSYLHRFPFDTIKIPREFSSSTSVSGIAATRLPILKAIITLAKDLGMNVVAEGVEAEKDLEQIKELNCNWIQGFIFGEAMSGLELTRKLKKPLR